MSDAWLDLDFEWPVAPGYDWKEWLDPATGQPVPMPEDGLFSLESATAVEFTVNHLGDKTWGPVLCARDATPGEIRSYRPMQREHAALFRTFAAIAHTDRDAIRTFASQYGWLGLRRKEQYIQGSATRPPHSVVGERYADWAQEICFMQEAIRFKASIATTEDWNRQRWLFDRQLQHVQGRAVGVPLRYVNRPLTLVSAMWLQLALTLEGTKRFIECKHCGRPMEISTDQTGFRTHREFCSDACKTKDYRQRKHQVHELAAQGVAINTIVQRVGTERATIRRWLAATNKQSQVPRRASGRTTPRRGRATDRKP